MLIAIDHGNKQIKTVHTQPFTSGLIQGDTPGFGTDCLAYQGKYYTLTDQRIPYRRDKTEDERFFILTLFAIAYEIEAMGRYSDIHSFRCGEISQECVHVTAQRTQNRGVDQIQAVHDLLRDPLYNTI